MKTGDSSGTLPLEYEPCGTLSLNLGSTNHERSCTYQSSSVSGGRLTAKAFWGQKGICFCGWNLILKMFWFLCHIIIIYLFDICSFRFYLANVKDSLWNAWFLLFLGLLSFTQGPTWRSLCLSWHRRDTWDSKRWHKSLFHYFNQLSGCDIGDCYEGTSALGSCFDFHVFSQASSFQLLCIYPSSM